MHGEVGVCLGRHWTAYCKAGRYRVHDVQYCTSCREVRTYSIVLYIAT